MSCRNVQSADVFAVQVHRDVVIEGEDRQCTLRLSLLLHVNRSAVARLAPCFQTLADVVVRDDGRLLLKKLVPSGVVSVVMRVDDETHRLVGNAFQGHLNSVGERRVLIIDDNDAVVSNRSPNVASGSDQHVNAARHLRDFNLHFAEVLILKKKKKKKKKKSK